MSILKDLQNKGYMHTPGPWTREYGQRFKHDQSAGVRGPNGLFVAAALDFNRTDRDEEVEANARLISKAPTMFEMLARAMGLLERSKRFVERYSSVPHMLETDLETLRVQIDDILDEIKGVTVTPDNSPNETRQE